MKRTIIQALAILGFLLFESPVMATTSTISIPIDDVDVHEGSRGEFYLVSVPIPADAAGKRIDSVVLEFAVDVAALSPEDSGAAPAVGVYPLTRPFSGGAGEGMDAPLFESNVSSVRPVTIGKNRIVRMDITEIVKAWVSDPSSNHGLVIGSLTGPEVGTVTLRDVLPDSDSAIRVTFVYQNRFGDRISERSNN